MASRTIELEMPSCGHSIGEDQEWAKVADGNFPRGRLSRRESCTRDLKLLEGECYVIICSIFLAFGCVVQRPLGRNATNNVSIELP